MENLNLNEMVIIEGGVGCGVAGDIMSVVGGVLVIVSLTNLVTGVVGAAALSGGISFGMAGAGCGIAGIIGNYV
ncbi:hypothetical protein EI427_21250 [Flammeovirga pectinis]|uniref:Bacteriocin n=1 Tax=Flammeovirga pectinis TaxID=2494373 RepID=A0A3S9P9B1_9BACT|nr:hypothetical protein [Flammeovirga pectinis]AZQ64754.1 hypothetical protein EI427_21250 [Flammeovirga pectinis]